MNIENLLRPVEILLVDDNPGDVRLMIDALREAKVISHVVMADDEAETMAILRRENGYGNLQPTDLILLDLNLPKKEGQEVLTEIKNDPNLSHIPVVIVTSSGDQQQNL